MKRLLQIIIFLSLCGITALAQRERIFLFENFDDATIYMKNKTVTKSPMNYDANNGKLYFMHGNDLMELTNLAQIDSIKFVGDRVFAVKNNDIVEMRHTPTCTLQILWRIRKNHEGYVGAFGNVSQAPSKKVRLSDGFGMGDVTPASGGMVNTSYTDNNGQRGGSINEDVWRMKTENTYIFTKDGKEHSIKRLSQLYKTFPEHKDQIKAYAKENHLDLSSAEKALALIDYALSL